jgi:hypothetical protein
MTTQKSVPAKSAAPPQAPTTGRKAWVKKTPVDIVLEQIGKQADKVAGMRAELTREERELAKLPGGRQYAVSWIDGNGDFWLFGGAGSYDLNDLWEFSPTTSLWTWVSGSSSASQPGTYDTLGVPAATNIPGARSSGVSWTDSSGNLWLFGGRGIDSVGGNGALNDLWRYQP